MEKSWPEIQLTLQSELTALAGCRLTGEEENYLHFVFVSKFFGFKDDVEFFFDQAAGLLQVRSASRLGRYDFGANRKRVEMLRDLLKNKI